MSQLIDKLRRLAKGTAPPLGFQPRSTPQEPPVLLIAHLQPGKAAPQGTAAVLVDGTGKTLADLTPPARNALWGVSLEAASTEEASRLKERGCDFLLLTSLESPAAALDTDMGRLVLVDPTLSDSRIRALGAVADAAVVDFSASALSIRCLMECHRLSALLGRPLLAVVSPELAGEEVRRLAGVGVRGIISRASKTKLQEWHKELLSHREARTPTPVTLPLPTGGEPPPEEMPEETE